MFAKQFFGPLTWKMVAGIALAHVLAFFIRDTGFEPVVLLAVFVATVWISQRSLVYGLMAAFGEIFVGGHGHLLDIDMFGFSLSLRMVIFAGVMFAWLWQVWTQRVTWHRDAWRELPFVILAIALVAGFLQGVVANGAGAAFDDANGYVVIGYLLPLMSIAWTSKEKHLLLQTFAASATWIVMFSLSLLYVFTHVDGKTLHMLYAFVRDSRLAEITLQVINDKESALDVFVTRYGFATSGGYFYRIFMPAQSTLMMVLMVCWSTMLFAYRSERLPDAVGIGAIASFAVLFMSLSRSFLLGTFVAMVVLWIVAIIREQRRWVTIKRSAWMVVCAAVALVVVYGLITVPVPTRPDLTDAAFYETSAETGRSEAVVSRWALLNPLMAEIAQNPLSGKGFGAIITYQSSDPRIIDETGGSYTTYRFEWGWHDIWLKMGILGLLAFLVYGLIIIFSVRYHVNKHPQSWLIFGLAGSVLALFVTHTFSPYLNHPIGIGWMLFILPFLDTRGWGKTIEQMIYSQRRFDKLTSPVITSRLAKIHSREN